MANIIEKQKLDASNNANISDWKLELFALFGFCISGVIFILSGIKSGDVLTIVGSSVWIFSCVVWMIPYRKNFSNIE
ncbi:MAG: hypothetical protein V7785_18560 [Bermanella sp.]